MGIVLHWFLPTNGDSRTDLSLGNAAGAAGSRAAEDGSERTPDMRLTWGEPPEAVAEKLDAVRTRAKRAGRELRFGIRLHVITRDTADEAWAQAQRLLDGLDSAA
jgi:alkanesulfonate monooxygenase